MSSNPSTFPHRAHRDMPHGASAEVNVGEHDAQSLAGLLRTLASDVSTLLTKEVALAKAEVRAAAAQTKAGVASMAGGAALTFAGVIILLLAPMYGLALVMPLWLSALIVGGIALGIGVAMLKAGQSKVEPEAFVPHRTAENLKKDAQHVKRSAS